MPEGLDPIEAGRRLHEHSAQMDDEAEREAGKRRSSADRHSRIVQICEAALLALVTVAAAWAGYSAAKWNTTSRIEVVRSATLRNLATRQELIAISLRNFDASTFNDWFIAYTLHDPQREAVAVRRFRPVFRSAFRAWMATDPLHNSKAPPGPTYMPQYKLAAQARASALDRRADAKFVAGSKAALISDDYIRITVFLAAVLFMVGIGSTFRLNGVRYALVVFGTVLLILSIILILRQPGLPD